jgi:hypothetical protein
MTGSVLEMWWRWQGLAERSNCIEWDKNGKKAMRATTPEITCPIAKEQTKRRSSK